MQTTGLPDGPWFSREIPRRGSLEFRLQPSTDARRIYSWNSGIRLRSRYRCCLPLSVCLRKKRASWRLDIIFMSYPRYYIFLSIRCRRSFVPVLSFILRNMADRLPDDACQFSFLQMPGRCVWLCSSFSTLKYPDPFAITFPPIRKIQADARGKTRLTRRNKYTENAAVQV